MPRAAARSVTRAPGRSQTTSATSAAIAPRSHAAAIASKLLPSPLAKTAIRFIGTLPDDDPFGVGDTSDDRRLLSVRREDVDGFLRLLMLKMLNISRWAIFPYFSRKRNTGRISHVPSSMAMPCPSCRIRGMFSSNPPPVMWLMPWTSHRRITSSTGFT